MDAETAIKALKLHESELRAAGVEQLGIFGSTARGEATEASDVDVVLRLSEVASRGGFEYVGRLLRLKSRLESILGCPVDVVTEPVRKPSLQADIQRDRIIAFQ